MQRPGKVRAAPTLACRQTRARPFASALLRRPHGESAAFPCEFSRARRTAVTAHVMSARSAANRQKSKIYPDPPPHPRSCRQHALWSSQKACKRVAVSGSQRLPCGAARCVRRTVWQCPWARNGPCAALLSFSCIFVLSVGIARVIHSARQATVVGARAVCATSAGRMYIVH